MDDSEASYEPMDVDLSSHSVSAMDISYSEANFEFSPVTVKKEREENVIETEKCLNIKPLIINNLIANQTQNHKCNNVHTNQISKLFTFMIVLFLSVMTYQLAHFKCSENLNVTLLRKSFASKIYGQTTATETLIKALESDVNRKIIILYGGTGVGKTYTASLLLENILKYDNIFHYTMPRFLEMSSDFMLGLIFCESSIFVVDDLYRNDIMNVKDHIEELVTKSEVYSKNITIMLLYNCDTMGEQSFRKCDETFLHDLKQSLANINAHKYFIKFQSLTKEHLRKCIESELVNKKFSEADIVDIMKNFNVTIDGCKGVYQKMKYLSIV